MGSQPDDLAMITVADLLEEVTYRNGPPREARRLLGHLLEQPEARLLGFPETPVPMPVADRFRELAARRDRHEPFAYLTGWREFYGRRFTVDSRVLIPRPETEHLIDAVLELELPRDATVLDVGTGTGCVACTLALERPDWRCVASDRSLGALAVAAKNRERLGLRSRVSLLASDLSTALRLERFDVIVANLPYIAPDELPTLAPDVSDYEPTEALIAEDAGRALIQALVESVTRSSSPPPLVLEVGWQQASDVAALARARGVARVDTLKDYAGIDRVVRLQSPDELL